MIDEVPPSPTPSKNRFQEFPTEADWNLLLKRAKYLTAEKDEVILEEGKSYQRIYQIIKGSVRIERKLPHAETSPIASPEPAPTSRSEQGLLLLLSHRSSCEIFL